MTDEAEIERWRLFFKEWPNPRDWSRHGIPDALADAALIEMKAAKEAEDYKRLSDIEDMLRRNNRFVTIESGKLRWFRRYETDLGRAEEVRLNAAVRAQFPDAPHLSRWSVN